MVILPLEKGGELILEIQARHNIYILYIYISPIISYIYIYEIPIIYIYEIIGAH